MIGLGAIGLAAVLAATLLYHEILVRAGGTVPWLDAATVAIGIAATGLQTFRFREQYIWWLVTDVFAVTQYVLKRDPVYTTKKAIYLIEAIVGLRNWHRLSQKNKTNE
jgi:nicotinamide mononucleotide transporter